MNWKIVIGFLLIFSAAKEMFSIISDYHSGELAFWPFGADIGCLTVVIAGIFLLRKGWKERSRIR